MKAMKKKKVERIGRRRKKKKKNQKTLFPLSRRRKAPRCFGAFLLFSLSPPPFYPAMRRLASLATAQTAAAGSQFVQKSKLGAVGKRERRKTFFLFNLLTSII